LRDGRGYLISTDGSLFEGNWKNNKANGRGRIIESNGSIFEGEFLDNKKHGTGVYTYNVDR
jgi:hypothetical protein